MFLKPAMCLQKINKNRTLGIHLQMGMQDDSPLVKDLWSRFCSRWKMSLHSALIKLRHMIKRFSSCGRTAPTYPKDQGTQRDALLSAALLWVINLNTNSEGLL